MKLLKVNVTPIGPGLHEHNMPCAICRLHPAVFCSPGFYFEPCWGCQSNGWAIGRRVPPGFWKRLWKWIW
jgi:hypothetical protein